MIGIGARELFGTQPARQFAPVERAVMIAIELCEQRGRGLLHLRQIKRSVAAGVVLIRAGLYSNCIRFMPPLTISEAELVEALGVVRASLAHVEEHGP